MAIQIEDFLKNSVIIKCNDLPEKVIVLTDAIEGFNVYEIFRSQRDEFLKVADLLDCDGECSKCECGQGLWCTAPTVAAYRIRKALGVE